jgi:hypothetical protein
MGRTKTWDFLIIFKSYVANDTIYLDYILPHVYDADTVKKKR